MTRLRIVILSFIGLVALLFALSWGTGRYWGRDVDTLQSNVEGGKFTAKRDATGVWSVQAADFPNLWFAFGYIHSQDREFQMELMRATATGRLSSWFGTATLPRDRLMRFSARLARREWEGLAPNDPLRQACESFVAGHNEYVKRNAARTPIEYRIFTLKREDIPAWEPWEVLAISRLHSWEFSYDAYEEARSFALSRTLGTEAAKLLLPGEPEDSPELMYRQPLVRGVKPQLAKLRLPLPKFHVPVVAGHASATTHPDTDSMQAYSTDRALNTDLGASNLWMIANPRTALEPTLCNDTHLSLSWPGALYPIRYQVGDIDAQGFSLPGTPGIVIGRVDRPGSNFVWGITLANYGDTQDLITVSSATIQKATKFEESFQVRDPKTFALSTQVFSEQWTQWGPRVDEVFDWKGTTPKEPVALDWFGFRETVSPMGFYMRRNMQGAEGLRDDLAKAWMFPAVNFTWIDRNAKDGTRFGHVMTGLLFDRERKGPRELLSEKDAAARKISQPAERPYLDYDYKGQEMFFTTTANQGAFAQPLGKRLAYEWGDRSRAKRILATLNEAVTKPEYAQTDYLSQNILEFVKRARERLSADRLCALGESEYLTSCFEVVSAMDRWDGTMAANRWEPTLAALWYVKTKQALWTGKLPASESSKGKELFLSWSRSNGSTRLLKNIMVSNTLRAQWEDLSDRSFNDSLLDAFRESLELLVQRAGPLTSSWAWGSFHQIEWQHPVNFIPGLGPWLNKSLFGPPPSVSGAVDTPGHFDFNWDPAEPLEFSAKHAAAMRMCTTLSAQPGPSKTRWTAATGVSGNPLSKWAWTFAHDFYFRDQLTK